MIQIGQTTTREVASSISRVGTNIALSFAAVCVFANLAAAQSDKISQASTNDRATTQKKDKLLSPERRAELIETLLKKGDGTMFSTMLSNKSELIIKKENDSYEVIEVLKNARKKLTGSKDSIEPNDRCSYACIGDDVHKIYRVNLEGKLEKHLQGALYQITENPGKTASQIFVYFEQPLLASIKSFENLDKRLSSLNLK